MEDAGNSTVPPPVPQADGNPDPTSYDDDDELLFLRLADVNNGPIQSELDAAIHGAKILGASAEEATAPPLMQRPKSSGIDMTGFSFPKPQQRKKSFSTRSSDKKQTAVLELDHQRDMGKLGSRGDEPSIEYGPQRNCNPCLTMSPFIVYPVSGLELAGVRHLLCSTKVIAVRIGSICRQKRRKLKDVLATKCRRTIRTIATTPIKCK